MNQGEKKSVDNRFVLIKLNKIPKRCVVFRHKRLQETNML